ncbi:MAG: 4-hydroxythreonine-4-phosphate dehydrogenase PdxA [Rhodoferax sp.]|nr:4-hydroxythreonine-4-phosphate dehydrogenase PdxA [Rhodoferax sp.]
MQKPIAITMGDAAGIGPEIIARCFLQHPVLLENVFVWGDVAAMRRAVRLVAKDGVPMPLAQVGSLHDLPQVPPHCLPVLQSGEPLGEVPYGQVHARSGAFAGLCVVQAAQAALRGELAAVVTAPLHKEALHTAGMPYMQYPGHTELLQAQAARHLGIPVAELPVRMMLANEELRTVLVSIHVSLREAIAAVTFENVLQTILITHHALGKLLGRSPRLAVAGLNPHAGEGGLFGREELDIIIPAMQAASSQGCVLTGPLAADTVFMRSRKRIGQKAEFDAVVAMYHDQGLIPVKYQGMDKGVNVTLGLPLVRTSPDHGTAFDIAGKGIADPSSLLEAIRMARSLATS